MMSRLLFSSGRLASLQRLYAFSLPVSGRGWVQSALPPHQFGSPACSWNFIRPTSARICDWNRQRLLPASLRSIRPRRFRTRRRLYLAQTHIFLTSRLYESIRRKKRPPQGAAFVNNLRNYSPSLCYSAEACAVCWSSIARCSATILAS